MSKLASISSICDIWRWSWPSPWNYTLFYWICCCNISFSYLNSSCFIISSVYFFWLFPFLSSYSLCNSTGSVFWGEHGSPGSSREECFWSPWDPCLIPSSSHCLLLAFSAISYWIWCSNFIISICLMKLSSSAYLSSISCYISISYLCILRVNSLFFMTLSSFSNWLFNCSKWANESRWSEGC